MTTLTGLSTEDICTHVYIFCFELPFSSSSFLICRSILFCIQVVEGTGEISICTGCGGGNSPSRYLLMGDSARLFYCVSRSKCFYQVLLDSDCNYVHFCVFLWNFLGVCCASVPDGSLNTPSLGWPWSSLDHLV